MCGASGTRAWPPQPPDPAPSAPPKQRPSPRTPHTLATTRGRRHHASTGPPVGTLTDGGNVECASTLGSGRVGSYKTKRAPDLDPLAPLLGSRPRRRQATEECSRQLSPDSQTRKQAKCPSKGCSMSELEASRTMEGVHKGGESSAGASHHPDVSRTRRVNAVFRRLVSCPGFSLKTAVNVYYLPGSVGQDRGRPALWAVAGCPLRGCRTDAGQGRGQREACRGWQTRTARPCVRGRALGAAGGRDSVAPAGAATGACHGIPAGGARGRPPLQGHRGHNSGYSGVRWGDPGGERGGPDAHGKRVTTYDLCSVLSGRQFTSA